MRCWVIAFFLTASICPHEKQYRGKMTHWPNDTLAMSMQASVWVPVSLFVQLSVCLYAPLSLLCLCKSSRYVTRCVGSIGTSGGKGRGWLHDSSDFSQFWHLICHSKIPIVSQSSCRYTEPRKVPVFLWIHCITFNSQSMRQIVLGCVNLPPYKCSRTLAFPD